jgi:zinc transport system permease protein
VSLLEFDFMRRALVAAVLVGLAAPGIGTFLVQRKLSLMGDGIGHIALTGVALGFLLGTAPVLTAIVVATAGAVAIELVRERGRASGDVALALLFYGGIAGGVLLIGLSPGGTNGALVGYLFGSLSSVTGNDLVVIVALSVAVLGVVTVFARELFAVCQDEEVAKVSGLPVRFLNLLVAVSAAVTVTVAMRVVGLLLVSALMVVPVAAVQQLTRSFKATLVAACLFGAVASVSGLVVAFYADVAPGAATVVLALGGFLVAAVVSSLRRVVTR